MLIEGKKGQVLNYKFFPAPADQCVGPVPNSSGALTLKKVMVQDLTLPPSSQALFVELR